MSTRATSIWSPRPPGFREIHHQPAARPLARVWRTRRRRNQVRARRRVSLAGRSTRRHHELRARLSGVLYFDRVGARRGASGRFSLRSHARRVLLRRAQRGSQAQRSTMQVSKTSKLGESLLGTGFPSHKRHKNPNIHFYHQFTLRSHGLRRAGSAALDLACVAAGRYDGFWEFNLNSWDTAAGVLLVQEAGGTVTRFDGSPFRLSSEEVLASNGMIHRELMQNFAEIFAGRGLEEIPSPVEYYKRRRP